LLPFLGPYINKKNGKENNIYIYQWEEYIKTSKKLPKTCWGGSKYTKLKNLTAFYQLMKALLANKN
jgi:hypothetical protein